MALTNEQRDEMLIRIDERQKHVKDKLEEAFSGPPNGFVRHEVYDNDKNSNTWFKRIIFSSVIVGLSKMAFDMFR
jgi:hypothetical protein